MVMDAKTAILVRARPSSARRKDAPSARSLVTTSEKGSLLPAQMKSSPI